jgi:phosphatidylserine decarboxylase
MCGALQVSPCDGRVLYHGPVRNGEMEQVKGITYSLRGFIGGDLAVTEGPPDPSRHLHHIILYLAPGDYHRFHAPADVAIRERRYFPGTCHVLHGLRVCPRCTCLTPSPPPPPAMQATCCL